MLDKYVNYIKQIEERYEWNKQKVWFDYGNYVRENYMDGRLFSEIYMGDAANIDRYPVAWGQLRSDQSLARKLSQVFSAGFAERRWQLSTLRRVKEIIQHIDGLIEAH